MVDVKGDVKDNRRNREGLVKVSKSDGNVICVILRLLVSKGRLL